MRSLNRSLNSRTTVFAAKIAAVLALALLTSQLSLAQYDISTIAGGGPNGLAALNGASIGFPGSIAFDAAGNAYIADAYSSLILKVTPGGSTGAVTVVAGNGTAGYSGDGGPATSAALDGPVGVALDSAGNIYIADFGNSLVREVTVANGQIQTIAGNFTAGPGYSGDGGPATSSQLDGPLGVFVDGSGNVFIADSLNSAIREITVANGKIQTVAGNGTYCADPTTACGDGGAALSANLDLPSGVFVDASGNIFIADTFTARVRVVNPSTSPSTTIAGVTIPIGDIQTVAGAYYNSEGGEVCSPYTGSGVALATDLCYPAGVFVDSSEDIFIADSNYSVIWEITAGSANIAAVAGTGTAGYSGDTGPATSAQLDSPNYAFVDSSGDIYIADTDNFVIREVTGGNISTIIGNNLLSYSGDGGTATAAQLNFPGGISVSASDVVYIADTQSSVVRVANLGTSTATINGTTIAVGDIQTVAGDALTPCQSPSSTPACGDGGPALSAQFNSPSGVATDAAGNIYIADTFDNLVRVVNTGSAAITIAGVAIGAGDVETIAGNGNPCTEPFATWPCGDGGSPTSAEVFQPQGVFIDSAGNIFIVDTDDDAVRVINTGAAALTLAGVTIQPGAIETVAGNGTECSSSSSACGDGAPSTSAQLSFPVGIFVDSSDNIYIADTGDNRIRVVNTGTASETIAGVTVAAGNIATVAGTGTEGYAGDGALATNAQMAGPSAVFVDSAGDLFVTDTANFVVREVVAGTWEIATIAGNNTQGFSGDGGASTSAQFTEPIGLFEDANANLFIADTQSSRIRELVPTAGGAPTAPQPPAQTASPGGTATFDIELNANTGSPKYPITLSCAQSSLPSGATCSFSPTKITPGPLPVPFTLTITIPSSMGALRAPSARHLQFALAFVPLAGILFAGMGLGSRRRRWALLAVLGLGLLLLNACGGGSSSSSGSGTTYNVQVQGTTSAQPTAFTITTASLTVQ